MPNYRYFETQERDGVHVLYLATVGADREAVGQLGRELQEFAEQVKPQRLAVSFRAITELTAPVIGKLLLFTKTVRSHGGRVECCDATQDFRDVLGMLGRSLPFDHAHLPEADVIAVLNAR